MLGFIIAFATCLVLLIAGRWAAAAVLGARGLRDAVVPWGSPEPARIRSARAFGSVLGWYLGAVLAFTGATLIGGTVTVDEISMRVTVAKGGPADRAGLRDGDRIVAVEDEPMRTWDELRAAVAKRSDEPTRVTFERDGASSVVVAVPQVQAGRARLLVGPHVVTRDAGIGEAFGAGLAMPFAIVVQTVKSFAGIALGERTELSGAAEIAREANRAKQIASGMKLGAGIASYVWPGVALTMLGLAFVRRRSSTART